MPTELSVRQHPGVFIKNELDILHLSGISKSDLCSKSGMSINTLNNLISGRYNVNITTAEQLHIMFGPSAQFWLNAQDAYNRFIYADKPGAYVRSYLKLQKISINSFAQNSGISPKLLKQFLSDKYSDINKKYLKLIAKNLHLPPKLLIDMAKKRSSHRINVDDDLSSKSIKNNDKFTTSTGW